jgi:hypothetical protein
MKRHKAEIRISGKTLKWLRRLLSYEEMTEKDFEKEEIRWDDTVFSEDVKFDDGKWADLRVCSGQNNLWAEMVLFSDGNEAGCTEPGFDGLEGEWTVVDDDDGDEYTVVVRRA